MTSKKTLMIEQAVELFAQNGYAATSVQDITEACGISKGSFYLSFKSKEDLLLEIFKYFSHKLTTRMAQTNEQLGNHDIRLEQFYQVYFEEISRYSNFILMFIREQTKVSNEKMFTLLNAFKKESYEQQTTLLTAIYGEQIQPFLPDLHVLINGMLSGYIELIIFNHHTFDFAKLSKHLVSITDAIVMNLKVPFLKKEQILGFGVSIEHSPITTSLLLEQISFLKNLMHDADTQLTLEIIEDELQRDFPRKPIFSGMMVNLTHIIEAKDFIQNLQKYIGTLD